MDEQSDTLLDPKFDPGGGAMGTLGADGSVETNWFVLLHRRVTGRAIRSPRYQWWALVALLAGLLSLNITFTVFVVALPTVKADFNTNFSVLAWASTGPLLAFGVAAPFFGKAGDLFGHRRLYQFGLLGAMVSAILTATAPDVGILLFARPRRGAGRGHRDGVDGDHPGTVLASGPCQGARMVVARGGRRPCARRDAGLARDPILRLADALLGAAGLARARVGGRRPSAAFGPSRAVAETRPPGTSRLETDPAGVRRSRVWEGMDWVGSWSLAGSVTAAMLVLSIGPIAGWTSPAVITSGVLAVVLTVVFVRREMTFATPLIPTTYWRRRNFMFPMGTKAFSSFAYFGGFFLFPLLMEQVYGYSVSQVGFISVARPLLFAISAPIAGYMTVRTGERTATLFGTASLLLSMILFATLSASAGLLVILIALALSGLGMGVSMPATSSTMSNELAASEYGVMSAAQLLAAQVGEVAGIQAVLTIQESIARHSGLGNVHHSPALLHSFSVPFWVGAGVAALAVVCAVFIRPLPHGARAARLLADAG